MEEYRWEDFFPSGIQLMVVDNDPTTLDAIRGMLLPNHYKVTTCGDTNAALSILCKQGSDFDLILAEVHMPNMNGFEFLKIVDTELSLPIILMSVDTCDKIKMEAMKQGACYFLEKPIDVDILKNIWKYVAQKKVNDNKANKVRNALDMDHQEDEEEEEDNHKSKKQRVTWTADLERKFLEAVSRLGSGAVPSKIQILMNVDGLRRKQIASHLQKYRLRDKRAKERELCLNSRLFNNLSTTTQYSDGRSISMQPRVVDLPRASIAQKDVMEMYPMYNILHVIEINDMLGLRDLPYDETHSSHPNTAANEEMEVDGIEMGTGVSTNSERFCELYKELHNALSSDTPANIAAANNQIIQGGARSNVMDLFQAETSAGVSANNQSDACCYPVAPLQSEMGSGASASVDRRHGYYDLHDFTNFPTATGEDDFIRTWDDYNEFTGEFL